MTAFLSGSAMTNRHSASVLETSDVKALLREQIEAAGGQAAFARKFRVSRVTLSKILHGERPLTKRIIKLLKLRAVYVRG
jgi:transcriptional regulator with XRE-family HTH domain